MADLTLKEYDKKIHEIYLKDNVNVEMWQTLVDKISEIRSSDDEVEQNNKDVLTKFGVDEDLFWQLNKVPDVNIYLSTFGGEIYNMFGIYDEIKRLDQEYNVNIYCVGKVMSAGTIIMLAVPLKQRFAYKNTSIMYHTLSSYGLEGKIPEIEESVDEAKRLHKMMMNIYKEETKLPKEKLNEVYNCKKDWFITPEQAIKYGVISKIV